MKKKKKKYLATLTVLWIKWIEKVEIKQKTFIDVLSIMTCQRSSWIMGPESSEFTHYDRASGTRYPG